TRKPIWKSDSVSTPAPGNGHRAARPCGTRLVERLLSSSLPSLKACSEDAHGSCVVITSAVAARALDHRDDGLHQHGIPQRPAPGTARLHDAGHPGRFAAAPAPPAV